MHPVISTTHKHLKYYSDPFASYFCAILVEKGERIVSENRLRGQTRQDDPALLTYWLYDIGQVIQSLCVCFFIKWSASTHLEGILSNEKEKSTNEACSSGPGMGRVFQDGGVQMVFGAMSWLQVGQQVLWPGAFRKADTWGQCREWNGVKQELASDLINLPPAQDICHKELDMDILLYFKSFIQDEGDRRDTSCVPSFS